MERQCKYCKNIYSDRASLSKHINYRCKLVPDDIKAGMIAKQEARKQKKDATLVQQQISINHSTTNNTTNNDNKQINFVNIINICGSEVPADLLQSIKEINDASIEKLRQFIPNLLQPFGSENISQLEDDSKKIIKYFNNQPEETFKLLLNDIHKLDENRNFAVPNVKYAIVQYVNDDFDIGKASKQEHIVDIQLQMKEVYNTLFSKYKAKIRSKYHNEHDVFLKNMMRRYEDIYHEFKTEAKRKKDAEVKKLKAQAAENGEPFDDRSILDRDDGMCPIPDYNTMTKEIIETYLTTNSHVNMMAMKEHKDKISAIKSVIGHRPPRKVRRISDIKEEERLKAKQLEAEKKVLEAVARVSNTDATMMDTEATKDATITSDEDALLTELETARGD
jgi:hypothetical protein